MKLKTIRKENNVTQYQLAKLIGSQQGQICRWERGESIPSIRSIRQLNEIFNCSLNKNDFIQSDNILPIVM
jgi:transcriptional regulator with XRE-family HTH domain